MLATIAQLALSEGAAAGSAADQAGGVVGQRSLDDGPRRRWHWKDLCRGTETRRCRLDRVRCLQGHTHAQDKQPGQTARTNSQAGW